MAGELDARGIALVGVSYDPPEVLKGFTEKHGLSYPLLADVGSRVITSLGLLDRELVAHHERFGIETKEWQHGVAYPAVFVIDGDGVVTAKRVREHYRAREGSHQLLEEALGIRLPALGATVTDSAPRVRVSAQLDGERYVRWEETRLHVTLEVEDGWHVYGAPVPEGYTELTVAVTSIPEVRVRSPRLPAPHPFRVEGLDEDFAVYEGRVEVVVPLAFEVPPDQGPVELRVGVRFQACSASECLPPDAVALVLQVEMEAQDSGH